MTVEPWNVIIIVIITRKCTVDYYTIAYRRSETDV